MNFCNYFNYVFATPNVEPDLPPSNITANVDSSTAIRVTWERVPLDTENGIITQYEIEFNQTTFNEISMSNVTNVSSSTFEVVLSGLEEYVNYSIRVRAYTSVGPGPYSDVIYETTPQDSK